MPAFGRYEILERLGVGGMAEVYRARAFGSDGFVKDLVVKKILPGHSANDSFRRLFVDEAKITVGLTHSNIVQVFDFGRVDDTYFIAMEQVNGIDLRRLLRSIEEKTLTIPIAVSLYVVHEILKGLDYAHRRADPQGRPLGIVHRDVSPANVLLSWEGEVKVADFGIARTAERATILNGQVVGKPRYMSPEQIRDEPLDGRSDVFSAGVVLHELLTGTQPFASKEDGDTFHQVLTAMTPRPTDTAPYLPKDLDPIVQKALARNRSERWPSAATMAEAIEEYALDHRLRLQPPTLSEFLRLAVSVPEATGSHDPPTKEVTVLSLVEQIGDVANFASALAPTEKLKAVSRPPKSLTQDRKEPPTLHPTEMRREGRRWFVVGIAAAAGIAALFGRGFFLPEKARATPTATLALLETPTAEPTATPTQVAIVTATATPVKKKTPTPVAPTPTAAPIPAEPGFLTFNSTPWGEVSIDGKKAGNTPLMKWKLEAGVHEVIVERKDLNLRSSFKVTVKPGEEMRLPGVELK